MSINANSQKYKNICFTISKIRMLLYSQRVHLMWECPPFSCQVIKSMMNENQWGWHFTTEEVNTNEEESVDGGGVGLESGFEL